MRYAIVCLLFGCVGAAPVSTPPPAASVDPVGTWALGYTFEAGPCGPELTLPETFVVTQNAVTKEYGAFASGFATPVTFDPGGSLTCDPDGCELDATLRMTDGTTTDVERNLLVQGADDVIQGIGDFTIANPSSSCTVSFTAIGERKAP